MELHCSYEDLKLGVIQNLDSNFETQPGLFRFEIFLVQRAKRGKILGCNYTRTPMKTHQWQLQLHAAQVVICGLL